MQCSKVLFNVDFGQLLRNKLKFILRAVFYQCAAFKEDAQRWEVLHIAFMTGSESHARAIKISE